MLRSIIAPLFAVVGFGVLAGQASAQDQYDCGATSTLKKRPRPSTMLIQAIQAALMVPLDQTTTRRGRLALPARACRLAVDRRWHGRR